MSMFCIDTRDLTPEKAREVWVECVVCASHLIDERGMPVDGWSVKGDIFNPADPAHVRRLSRYRAFPLGGTAGRSNFVEKAQAVQMLYTLYKVAKSDPKAKWLRGRAAREERQRVWSV